MQEKPQARRRREKKKLVRRKRQRRLVVSGHKMIRRPEDRQRDSTVKPSLRDRLTDRVARGTLAPADADVLATKAKIRLSGNPDAERFNPRDEGRWSLLMAAAWMSKRSADDVRGMWDRYRRDSRNWAPVRWQNGPKGKVFEGFQLKALDRATPLLLAIQTASKNPQGKPAMDSKAELWKALEHGIIEAVGVEVATGRRMPIPRHEWAELDWAEVRAEDPLELQRGGGIPAYRRVNLSSADIVEIWPPHFAVPKTLPETVKPAGSGFMALFAAALWIGNDGGQRQFALGDLSVWKFAYGELLIPLAEGSSRYPGFATTYGRSFPPRPLSPLRSNIRSTVDQLVSEPPGSPSSAQSWKAIRKERGM